MSLYNDIMNSDYWLSRVIQGIVGLVQMTVVLALVMGGLGIAWLIFSAFLRSCGIIIVSTDGPY